MMVLVPSKMMEKFDQEKDEVNTSSSPKKLMDGGIARLARMAKIHQVHVNGRMVCNPRAKIIIRLLMRS